MMVFSLIVSFTARLCYLHQNNNLLLLLTSPHAINPPTAAASSGFCCGKQPYKFDLGPNALNVTAEHYGNNVVQTTNAISPISALN